MHPARESVVRPNRSKRVAFGAPSPGIFAGQAYGNLMLDKLLMSSSSVCGAGAFR